mmetsp:Transcript_54099/g.132265  ORF Transcript_54099/g.132265 Transcript_54099/m.132265 type:complete len:114 (-) Transcript_54099:234-575(-)
MTWSRAWDCSTACTDGTQECFATPPASNSSNSSSVRGVMALANAQYSACAMTWTLGQKLRPGTGSCVHGGLGGLTTAGEYEVWVCCMDSEVCGTAESAFCYAYHQGEDRFQPL